MSVKTKRPMVTEGKTVPPKIAALLSDPVRCSSIARAWDDIREIGLAVIMDLPKFCQDRQLDPSATVTAANKILTTMEVFRDQAKLDRENSIPHEDHTRTTTRKPARR